MAISKRVMGMNSSINVTPMADVMLVLLIIFMVITPMLQKGVSVELAKTKNPVDMKEADRDDAVLVAITRDGKFYLGQDKVNIAVLRAAIALDEHCLVQFARQERWPREVRRCRPGCR